MVDFIWYGKPESTRGPKPALTLDQIADAAIAVADAEGLEAVSMQRVAQELGKTKMALYRYVPGKTELISAMLERGLGGPPEMSEKGWREALTDWAEGLLRRYADHPWTIEATLGNRPIGPNEISWMERAVAVLPKGLTGAERLDAVATLAAHARGLAVQAGQPESQFTASMALVLREHADRFPEVTAAMIDIGRHGGGDQAFRFGLERILDGLEALLTRRTQTGVRDLQVG